MTQRPEQSVGCRFWDDEKQICRALTELICADRRCSMRLTEYDHAESCDRARKRCGRIGIAFQEVNAKARKHDDGNV